MKAVVFHGVGDIRLDDVPEPTIQEPTDAIVRLTSSAICGTDLHMIRGGNCNHRRYIPKLVGLVATGALDPTEILTQREPATGAIEAYETFDQRKPGWIKVELLPEAS